MNLIDIAGVVIISLGIFFLMIGSIGLLRLPDFYSRAHATGKSDTLGLMMVFSGLIIIEGFHMNSIKILLVMIFVGFTSPTATNAIMRAAYRFRLRPWFKNDQKDKDR